METLWQNISATPKKGMYHHVQYIELLFLYFQKSIRKQKIVHNFYYIIVVLQTQKESLFFQCSKPFKFFPIQSTGLQMILSKHAQILFFQACTVHAEQGEHVFHCLFVLPPNKIEVTYTRFLQEVFNHVNGNPDNILLDFERSTLKAVNNVKTQVKKKGCFYNLCSNIWKYIQNLGL